jgi:hypothetical protein
MIEEFNEQEGAPTSSACVRACRPMMRHVVIRQQCTALPVKGGSATRMLRTKIGIRVCVNRERKAARLSSRPERNPRLLFPLLPLFPKQLDRCWPVPSVVIVHCCRRAGLRHESLQVETHQREQPGSKQQEASRLRRGVGTEFIGTEFKREIACVCEGRVDSDFQIGRGTPRISRVIAINSHGVDVHFVKGTWDGLVGH